MAKRELIVVGASAGGVDALTRFCSLLPKNLEAAVLIILHVTPSAKSRLPHILNRTSPLHVSHAKNGDQLRPGQIIVAPPNNPFVYQRQYFLRMLRFARIETSLKAIGIPLHVHF